MKKSLNEIAEIRTGYLFRGRVKHDPAGTVLVVQIKDVDAERRVDVKKLDWVTIDRPEPYLIEAGDVLFLSRGHRLYATVVPEVESNTIATGYFFILRPKKSLVTPEFLAWSLNDADFQEMLRPYHHGTHIPTVSRVNFESLRIQIPSLDLQRQILTLNQLADEERRLSAALVERRLALVQAISRDLRRG